MARVAVLDDYNNVAQRYLGQLPASIAVTAYGLDDHTTDENALVQRLKAFDIVVAMRERTPFPSSLLEKLQPALKLLITTGAHNAAIDAQAASRLGIAVAGTGGVAAATAELTWAVR